MSLGDYVRLLRAQRGGHDHADFAAAYGDGATKQLHLLEMRQRDISDGALLEKIAVFYGVSVPELQWHRQRSRKALSRYLLGAQLASRSITLRLRTGEEQLAGGSVTDEIMQSVRHGHSRMDPESDKVEADLGRRRRHSDVDRRRQTCTGTHGVSVDGSNDRHGN